MRTVVLSTRLQSAAQALEGGGVHVGAEEAVDGREEVGQVVRGSQVVHVVVARVDQPQLAQQTVVRVRELGVDEVQVREGAQGEQEDGGEVALRHQEQRGVQGQQDQQQRVRHKPRQRHHDRGRTAQKKGAFYNA